MTTRDYLLAVWVTAKQAWDVARALASVVWELVTGDD